MNKKKKKKKFSSSKKTCHGPASSKLESYCTAKSTIFQDKNVHFAWQNDEEEIQSVHIQHSGPHQLILTSFVVCCVWSKI